MNIPEDILAVVFAQLGLRELLACELTCRAVRQLILGSTRLQYHRELLATQSIDAHPGPCPTHLTPTPTPTPTAYHARLDALRANAAAWRFLHWAHAIPLASKVDDLVVEPTLDLGQTTITRGVLTHAYLQPFASKTFFTSYRLPTHAHPPSSSSPPADPAAAQLQPTSHRQYPFQRSAIQPSSDLVADWRGWETPRSTIHLLSLSSGKPHPLAATPILQSPSYGGLIELNGDILTLVEDLSFDPHHPPTTSERRISLWNWKTGERHMYTEPSAAAPFIAFLDTNVQCILRTGSSTHPPSLEVFSLPGASSSSASDTSHRTSFQLPRLREEHTIDIAYLDSSHSNFQGSDPANWGSDLDPHPPTPESCILAISFHVHTNEGQETILLVADTSFLLATHAAGAAAAAAARPKTANPDHRLQQRWYHLAQWQKKFNAHSRTRTLRWSEWGTRHARFMHVPSAGRSPKAFGSRVLFVGRDARDGSRLLEMLDFNPYGRRNLRYPQPRPSTVTPSPAPSPLPPQGADLVVAEWVVDASASPAPPHGGSSIHDLRRYFLPGPDLELLLRSTFPYWHVVRRVDDALRHNLYRLRLDNMRIVCLPTDGYHFDPEGGRGPSVLCMW